jgi:hypothetical protein
MKYIGVSTPAWSFPPPPPKPTNHPLTPQEAEALANSKKTILNNPGDPTAPCYSMRIKPKTGLFDVESTVPGPG